MQPEQVIREHLKLCERTHDLLLRENKHLKDQGTPTSKELIEEKKQLLPLLDHSVTALNKLRREDFSPFGDGSALMQKAQNKLMQIFYIDRENEQLLLKASMQTTSSADGSLGGKITQIRDVQAKLAAQEENS